MYKVRSTVAYTWDQGTNSLDLVKQLYNDDESFKKLVNIVKKQFLNVFEGTDPNHQVIEDKELANKVISSLIQKKLAPSFVTAIAAKRAKNPYKKVASLMTEDTDTIYRTLILFARYELCTDPSFINVLEQMHENE